VDQAALIEVLSEGRLDCAFLDVTEPEPLPPDHPLWTTPRCFITPHSAGGRSDGFEALVHHFVTNLRAFEAGAALVDRIW
jgi:phosphoglycerate dehydrogenase-like enzyme